MTTPPPTTLTLHFTVYVWEQTAAKWTATCPAADLSLMLEPSKSKLFHEVVDHFKRMADNFGARITVTFVSEAPPQDDC